MSSPSTIRRLLDRRAKRYEQLKQLNPEGYRKAIEYSEGLCLNLGSKLDHLDCSLIEAAFVSLILEYSEK